jgi:hypothetical protein
MKTNKKRRTSSRTPTPPPSDQQRDGPLFRPLVVIALYRRFWSAVFPDDEATDSTRDARSAAGKRGRRTPRP